MKGKEKRELPVWSVVAAIAAAIGFVVVLFFKAGSAGEASREELIEIRSNQRKFSSAPAPNPDANATTTQR
ncbi:MAG: hypothetical protein ACO1SV_14490 [Fimbriimonas sp.]